MGWQESDIHCGELAGTLTLPDGGSPVAAALILPGSGPVDRNGNLPGMASGFLELLARELAAKGIASIRIDKRGIGGSASAGPAEEELRFGQYVDDAVAWLRTLRTATGDAPQALIGHSEGALVATLAAQKADIDRLVLVAGAGAPAAEIILRQLRDAVVPEALYTAAQRILDHLLRGECADDVPRELAALFRPSVQPYLMSWLAIDPAAELAAVETPALVISGTHDLQVGPEDADRLAAARAGIGRTDIDGMNHVLKSAPRDRAGNFALYNDPAAPLASGLVAAIAGFLTDRASG